LSTSPPLLLRVRCAARRLLRGSQRWHVAVNPLDAAVGCCAAAALRADRSSSIAAHEARHHPRAGTQNLGRGVPRPTTPHRAVVMLVLLHGVSWAACWWLAGRHWWRPPALAVHARQITSQPCVRGVRPPVAGNSGHAMPGIPVSYSGSADSASRPHATGLLRHSTRPNRCTDQNGLPSGPAADLGPDR
jgi:hypothetical protein